MKIKVEPLVGYKSIRALNAFSALAMGLKMLPAYQLDTFEDFLSKVHAMSEEDQMKIIREGLMFVELSKEEVEAVASFVKDVNGVPYSSSNIHNLNTSQLVDVLAAVLFEIAQMEVDVISEDEKKNLKGTG